MELNNLFQIRVTGVLIENQKLLVVKQKVSPKRSWSLPGGRLERGETIEQGMIREMEEETGLKTEVIKLLYLCDKQDIEPPLLHITFLLKKIGGAFRMPSNEHDSNPISDIKMIDVEDIVDYGFSKRFKEIVKNSFPNSGSYVGHKSFIGL